LLTHATRSISNFYEWIRRAYLAYRNDEMSTAAPFETGQAALADARKVAQTLSSYGERARSVGASSGQIKAKVAALTQRIRHEPLLSTPDERRFLSLLEEARAALEAAEQLSADIGGYEAEAQKLSAVVEALGPRLDLVHQQLADFSSLAGLGLVRRRGRA
jgi:phage shock protein A